MFTYFSVAVEKQINFVSQFGILVTFFSFFVVFIYLFSPPAG